MSMTQAQVISDSEAAHLTALNEQYRQWVGKRTSYKHEELPEHLQAFGNDERAKLEQYHWVKDVPDRQFAYYTGNAETGQAITGFMGNVLGKIVHAGQVWQSNFGDKRRSVLVEGVNGACYKGIAQLSHGNYVRLRICHKH